MNGVGRDYTDDEIYKMAVAEVGDDMKHLFRYVDDGAETTFKGGEEGEMRTYTIPLSCRLDPEGRRKCGEYKVVVGVPIWKINVEGIEETNTYVGGPTGSCIECSIPQYSALASIAGILMGGSLDE